MTSARPPPFAIGGRRVPGLLEPLLELGSQLLVDRQQVCDRGSVEVQVVQLEKAVQLVDRSGVVVDAQVDPAVVVTAVATVLAHDEQGGRLAATLVAATLVGGLERL